MIKTALFASHEFINGFIEQEGIKREDIINIAWKDNEHGYSAYNYVLFYFSNNIADSLSSNDCTEEKISGIRDTTIYIPKL